MGQSALFSLHGILSFHRLQFAIAIWTMRLSILGSMDFGNFVVVASISNLSTVLSLLDLYVLLDDCTRVKRDLFCI